MSVDNGPSTIGDIIRRLGVSPGYVQQYRKRLLDAGLVVQSGWGKLDLALPHLRQYLRQHPDRSPGMAAAASWADDEFPF
jgi:winged helix-turn-helix DNA-binding protein